MHRPRSTRRRPQLVLALLALAALALTAPRHALALDFHVDPATGDDARGPLEAQSPATPWASLQTALRWTTPGNTIRLHPGVYTGSAATRFAGVRVVADQGRGTVFLDVPAGQAGLDVRHHGFRVEGVIVRGGATGLRAENVDGLQVHGCAFVGQTGAGVRVVGSSSVLIDSSTVASAGRNGIELESSRPAYLRNNLVYASGEWGILLEGVGATTGEALDTVVAFSTVAYNGGTSGGGVRVLGVAAEIRDSIVAFNGNAGLRLDGASTWVHHTAVFGSPRPALPEGHAFGAGMVAADPLLANPAGDDGILGGVDGWQDDDFSLRQLASGDARQSPAVDAGSGSVDDAGIGGTTRGDAIADDGAADLGVHRGAPPATSAIPAPAPTPSPGAGQGGLHHVDCSSGDDARSKLEARNPATPWRTMQRAAQVMTPGDVAVVAPGTCEEQVETRAAGVTFVAAAEGSVVVAPPAGRMGFNVQHDDVTIDGFVVRSPHQGVLAAKPKAGDVLRNLVLRNLVVEPPPGGALATNGVQVRDADAVTIESSVIRGAAQQGVKLLRVSNAYVRNNLVTGHANDWAISIDGDSPNRYAPATGNVAAFNTVWGNLRGLRFRNSYGEIRDNVVSSNTLAGIKYDLDDAGWMVHHNDAFGSGSNFDLPSGVKLHPSNLSVDPGLVDPANGNFALRQLDGETPASPLVDAGSASVDAADIDGSTRTDGAADSGVADLGFHAGGGTSASDPGGPGPSLPPGTQPTPTPVPSPGAGTHLHVDCTSGDDTRSKLDVRSAATPWRTIQRAAQLASVGDVVMVAAGTCAEQIETRAAGVSFVAQSPGSVVIAPGAGRMGFNVQHDDVTIDGFVVRSPHQGVLAAKPKAGDLLRNLVLRNLVVEPPVGGALATNGIQVRDAEHVTIESSAIRGAAQQGVKLLRVSNAYVRNNLVIGHASDWAISIDGDSPNRYAPALGNVAAFNTVWGNLRGLRFRNSYGEIRDNIVAGNSLAGIKYDLDDAGWMVHHNDAFGSVSNYDLPSGVKLHPSNLSVDPSLVDPTNGNFALRQLAGETPASPLVDAGSATVDAAEIDGSTRTDGAPDAGVADLGYHAGASASSSAPGGSGPSLPPGPTPVPTPSPVPSPGQGARLHVDCASGDDTRSKLDARNAATPWRTLQRATQLAATGDVIDVAPGTCAEQIETRASGVKFLARTPGAVVVAPGAGRMGFNVQHDDVTIDGFVVRSPHQGVLAAKPKAGDLLKNLVLRKLVVEPPLGGTVATNGIQVRDADAVTIDSSIIRGAAQQGVKLLRVSNAYVRNNLVTGHAGDWAISIDGDSPNRYAPVVGNVAAFNTVWGNLRGLRFRNAYGEIRDNVVAGNTLAGIKYDLDDAGWMVHHNDAFGSVTDYDLPSGVKLHPSNLSVDPGLVDPANGDFALRQLAGETPASPLVDAGSATVDAADIDGSTRTDGAPDAGIADLGYHAGATASASAPGGSGPSLPPGPTPVPAPTPTSAPGSGPSYHVDPTSGDDGRSAGDARSPGTAWRTITHAINAALPGDTIVLRAGTYHEALDFKRRAITVVGDGALGDVVLVPPAGHAGINVVGHADVTVRNLVVQGATQGVVARGAPDLRLTGVAIVSSASNGISIEDSARVWIESSVVTGSGAMGVKLKQSAPGYLRNNLVYANGDWGISLDHTATIATSGTGNVVAFNTVHGNASGIRLLGTSGEVRDNLITGHPAVGLYLAAPDVTVHHNAWSDNGRDRDQKDEFLTSISFWSNVTGAPRYVDPDGADGVLGGAGWRDDDFRLQQVAAGDARQSAAIDAGSGAVADLDISGSTARSLAPDAGVADIGFHAGALPGVEPPAPMPVGSNLERVFYVDGTLGDDTRSNATARRRATPWRTLGRAMNRVQPGDTVVVLPGVYAETLQVDVERVAVLAEEPGAVFLDPPAGNGVTIEAPDVTVDGLVVRRAATGFSLLASGARATLRNCAAIDSATDGIRAVRLTGVTIESCVVASARGSGIRLKEVRDAQVHNNLVYASGEWGVSLDASGDRTTPSTGNVIGLNTLYANRAGNLALMNALGDVHDNLLVASPGRGLRVDTPGARLLHNGFHGNTTALDPPGYLLSCASCTANVPLEPRFLAPAGADGVLGGDGWADDDFRLRSPADGGTVSEAIDSGSAPTALLGVAGTTSTSGAADEGVVDHGFHYYESSRALPLPQ